LVFDEGERDAGELELDESGVHQLADGRVVKLSPRIARISVKIGITIIFIKRFSIVQVSWRPSVASAEAISSFTDIYSKKQIATPPKNKSGGSQKLISTKCTVEKKS
jgi:hypothetical protein